MGKYTRKCVVCGKHYEYCNTCMSYSDKPTWMTMFHDENCKNIFEITSAYYAGSRSDEVIREQLLACDLSGKDQFTKKTQEVIEKFMDAPKPKAKRAKKKVLEAVVEEVPVEEIATEVPATPVEEVLVTEVVETEESKDVEQ